MRFLSKPLRPIRVGAMKHIKYAVDLAQRNPKVFIPGAVGAVTSLLSGYVLESWDVYQDLMSYILRLYEAQMEIIPMGYTSDTFSYTRLLGWVPVTLVFLGLLGWASSLASIHIGWSIIRGEKGDVRSSFTYVARNLRQFTVAILYTALFSVLTVAVYTGLILGSDAIGLERAIWAGLLFSAALVVVVFLAGPVYIVMVGDNVSFTEALRLTLLFTRRRAISYLGIGIVLFLLMVGLGLIPRVGVYLYFIVGSLENLAVSDLYTQYKEAAW